MTNTMSGSDLSLRSLRDRPFELLKELEKTQPRRDGEQRSGRKRRP